MSAVYGAFEWLAELYETTFAEWLYIHFAVRTLILLLLVWAAVYIAAQLFKYLIGPLLVLFWYHAVFRAWNFLFVETPMEWIYIHYFSHEKTFLSETYLRLCDRVNGNRLTLAHKKYKGILLRGGVKRAGRRLMIAGLIFCTLWVVAFGLYQRYGRTEYFLDNTPVETETPPTPKPPENPGPTPTFQTEEPTERPAPSPEDLFFTGASYLMLNEFGADGSNVRDKPHVRTAPWLKWCGAAPCFRTWASMCRTKMTAPSFGSRLKPATARWVISAASLLLR